MSDFLGSGMDWLAGQRHVHLTRTVTYSRGGESIELSASVFRGQAEVQTADGVFVAIQAVEFLIRAEDLVLSGAAARPAAGDRIEYTRAGWTVSCEVLALAGGAVFVRDDSGTVRIHTKLISEVEQ